MSGSISNSKDFTSGESTSFIFDEKYIYNLMFSDFIESKLSGNLKQKDALKNKNFLKSSIDFFCFKELDFRGCDFLDSLIRDGEFIDSSLIATHITSCKLERVTFDNCEISETNYQNTTFEKCTFKNCIFSNILFKNCKFIHCNFIGGETTNKLFESCLLLECSFERIELQIQSIIDNFGITIKQCENTVFRDKRKREDYEILSPLDIKKRSYDNLANLLIYYFLQEESEQFYKCLFKCIDEPDWIGKGAYHTVSNKLEYLTLFLMFLYESNKIFLLPILKLNDLTQKLINQLEESNSYDSRSICRIFYGVKHELANDIGSFLQFSQSIINTFPKKENNIILLMNGPVEKEYYRELFSSIEPGVSVLSVTPQNSPNYIELLIQFPFYWGFISLILTTQYKRTLENISSNFDEEKTNDFEKLDDVINGEKNTKKLPKNISYLSSVSLDVGFLSDEKSEIGFKKTSVFSNGMVEKIGLSISPKRAIELNKSFINFKEFFDEKLKK